MTGKPDRFDDAPTLTSQSDNHVHAPQAAGQRTSKPKMKLAARDLSQMRTGLRWSKIAKETARVLRLDQTPILATRQSSSREPRY